MAESWTTRFALRRWTAGTDTPSRTEFDTSFANIEANAAGFTKGLASARPAAAAALDRWFYWATDTFVLSYCDGTTWRNLGNTDALTFVKEGDLEVAAGKGELALPFSIVVLGVTARLGTAPTGASAIFDLNRNGTTMFTTQANRPSIAAAAKATAASAVPDVTAVTAGTHYLTFDIDQVGSTVPGADLTAVVHYLRA